MLVGSGKKTVLSSEEERLCIEELCSLELSPTHGQVIDLVKQWSEKFFKAQQFKHKKNQDDKCSAHGYNK